MSSSRASQSGFTLIELIVTIAVSAVVVGFMVIVTSVPVDTYLAQARRAQLTDSTSRIWSPLERDLRTALPGSVRVAANGGANTVAIEMLATNGWTRYRDAVLNPTLAAPDVLNLTAADDSFTVMGKFSVGARPYTAPANVHLVTNERNGALDPYAFILALPNTLTTTIADATNPAEDLVTFNPPVAFNSSPSRGRRMFIVTGAVLYLCNLNDGTLRRYTGYSIQPGITTTAGALAGLGAAMEVVSRNLTACSFLTTPANESRGDLVRMDVTVAINGESTRSMHQGHVGTPL